MTEKFEGISKYTKTATKEDNVDTLSAAEWNNISKAVDDSQTAINSLIDDMQGITPINVPGETTDPGVVSVTSKGNTEITSAKNINLEPAYVEGGGEGTYGDIQLKPGDDITLESSHRASSKQGEITIKTSNGKGKNDPDKGTVKLELKTADLELSTEGKPGNDQNVMNVNVTTGNGKGYLKVRAQAIDLRCEDHGGVALQPMGTDGQGHENKIKFEHGGGDGLEFATFNTEKTSIYTDEYRFKKNGVWKMATRTVLDNNKNLSGTQGVTVGNGKYDPDHDDETKHYSYKKQSDDFYDIIDYSDPTCTTEQIINIVNKFSVSNESTTIAGKQVPRLYKIEQVTLNDVNDDSDFVLDHNVAEIDLPQTGQKVPSGKAKIYNLLDMLDALDATHLVDMLNDGTSVTISYEINSTSYSYIFTKFNSNDIVEDLLKLLDYFKTNHQGPWA